MRAGRKPVRSVRQRFDARGVFVFVATPFDFTRNCRGLYHPDLDGMAGNTSHFSRIKGNKTLVIRGGLGAHRRAPHRRVSRSYSQTC